MTIRLYKASSLLIIGALSIVLTGCGQQKAANNTNSISFPDEFKKTALPVFKQNQMNLFANRQYPNPSSNSDIGMTYNNYVEQLGVLGSKSYSNDDLIQPVKDNFTIFLNKNIARINKLINNSYFKDMSKDNEIYRELLQTKLWLQITADNLKNINVQAIQNNGVVNALMGNKKGITRQSLISLDNTNQVIIRLLSN